MIRGLENWWIGELGILNPKKLTAESLLRAKKHFGVQARRGAEVFVERMFTIVSAIEIIASGYSFANVSHIFWVLKTSNEFTQSGWDVQCLVLSLES